MSATPATPPPASADWPARLEAAAASFQSWLRRPRVRLCVVGLLLLSAGTLVVTSSMWTLPLVIGGALMVLVAWVGPRLDGQVALEWGAGGTRLRFRAEIKPSAADTLAPSSAQDTATGSGLDDAEIVEGEAHTVEIDVAELKALIAAAESDVPADRDGVNVAAIRVAGARR